MTYGKIEYIMFLLSINQLEIFTGTSLRCFNVPDYRDLEHWGLTDIKFGGGIQWLNILVAMCGVCHSLH